MLSSTCKRSLPSRTSIHSTQSKRHAHSLYVLYTHTFISSYLLKCIERNLHCANADRKHVHQKTNCFQTAFVNGYGVENKDEEPPWCAGDSAYTHFLSSSPYSAHPSSEEFSVNHRACGQHCLYGHFVSGSTGRASYYRD